jgi:hypothetical protein
MQNNKNTNSTFLRNDCVLVHSVESILLVCPGSSYGHLVQNPIYLNNMWFKI